MADAASAALRRISHSRASDAPDAEDEVKMRGERCIYMFCNNNSCIWIILILIILFLGCGNGCGGCNSCGGCNCGCGSNSGDCGCGC